MIDLVGRSNVQRRMRAMMVVPGEEQLEFCPHGVALKQDHNEPSALNLHGLDESLQDCDASMFAYGSERCVIPLGRHQSSISALENCPS